MAYNERLSCRPYRSYTLNINDTLKQKDQKKGRVKQRVQV